MEITSSYQVEILSKAQCRFTAGHLLSLLMYAIKSFSILNMWMRD